MKRKKEEDKVIATDGLLGFPKPGLRSSGEGEWGGPVAGRLEGMKIPLQKVGERSR